MRPSWTLNYLSLALNPWSSCLLPEPPEGWDYRLGHLAFCFSETGPTQGSLSPVSLFPKSPKHRDYRCVPRAGYTEGRGFRLPGRQIVRGAVAQ